jgi:hypothetical protein
VICMNVNLPGHQEGRFIPRLHHHGSICQLRSCY